MNETSPHLVWIDLEMTGLNPESDEIIEIATIITNTNLETIAEGPNLILSQPASRFEKMDAWNQKQHKSSGLWEKVLESNITVEKAEAQTLEFLLQHIEQGSKPALAGNSIWQDRRFITKYMPKLDSFLHYRMLDVSSLKLCVNWWGTEKSQYTKSNDNHRALDDIKESINEMKHYKDQFINLPNT